MRVRSKELEAGEIDLRLWGFDISSVLSIGSMSQSRYIIQLTKPQGVDLSTMDSAIDWVA